MPAPLAAAETCEGAWVSGQVASQTRNLPHLNGKMVQLSGCFPSEWYNPEVSSLDGMLAADSDL